jgi:hypothetical protein
MPLDATKQYIQDTGFKLIRCDDVTDNIELTAGRWHDSRARQRDALIQIEGQERFEGLQRFFFSVYKLAGERRLSRLVFVAEK